MATPGSTNAIQERVWHGRVPLQIVLSPSESRVYDKADPYLISYPRISYLPLLLPRLFAFFSSSLINPEVEAHHGWFSFEGVPLKWHYPLGLLFDLYAGTDPATSKSGSSEERLSASQILPEAGRQHPKAQESEEHHHHHDDRPQLPWRLTVHFNDWPDQDLVRLDAAGKVLHDAFINSVKEADFLRNGTAKKIMALSKEDSFGLWQAVQDRDFAKYHRIHSTLLPAASSQFRNIPLRIFLPSTPDSTSPSLKVIQSTFPPAVPGTSAAPSGPSGRQSQPQIQTIGTALNSLMPGLFPSRRFPVLAKPVLHGTVVPMTAPLEEVVRSAAYADGWLGIVVSMVG